MTLYEKVKAEADTKYKATNEAYDEWEKKDKEWWGDDETDKEAFEVLTVELYEAEKKWKKLHDAMILLSRRVIQLGNQKKK